MKKIIFMICLILLEVISTNVCVAITQEEFQTGGLYIDGQYIENDVVLYEDLQEGRMWLLPFRTILETLGADVLWYESSEKIRIKYREDVYLCSIYAPNDRFPEHRYLYVIYEKTKNYMALTPMGAGGVFKIIDDRIYLSKQCSEYLLKALGFSAYFDEESDSVIIRPLE